MKTTKYDGHDVASASMKVAWRYTEMLSDKRAGTKSAFDKKPGASSIKYKMKRDQPGGLK